MALQFSLFDNIGTVVRSEENPSTVAMLVNRYYENGLPVLVSQLNITVSPDILNAFHSVVCINAVFDTMARIQFESNSMSIKIKYIHHLSS